MPDRPARALVRDHDGSVGEGLIITHLIPVEERARSIEGAARVLGGRPPTIEIVSLADLDALE